MIGQELQISTLRKQFPILNQVVNGHPLIYFDNAATNQKPQRVIDALVDYYTTSNANIHRGIHSLAERATRDYEATRTALQGFIHSREAEEIIFTRGVTESINLVANSYGSLLNQGDEIIISGLEHHSNIVPWQLLAERKSLKIKVIPVLEDGSLDLDGFKALLTEKTKLVAVNHASNSLGTINPVKTIIDCAHQVGSKVLVDGAQAGAHLDIDVIDLDCDFYCLSSHKMYGPTGTGILYGKRALLEAMPPWQGGGEMISEVSFARTTYNELPYKFEAGTPNIADVIAFKHALEFIQEIGKDSIHAHEKALQQYCQEKLATLPGVRLYGTASEKVAVVAFTLQGIHHFDAGQLLDARGIAVRTGHHCTQPLMERFGIEGTIRASFSVYNTLEEVDTFLKAVEWIVNRKK